MAVEYAVVTKRNPGDPSAAPKFYAQAKASGNTTLRGLAKRIADISTVSTIDMLAVLEAFLQVIPEEIADGRIVRLGDFGSFGFSISSEGSETEEEVTASNIKSLKARFRPGKLFKNVLNKISFTRDNG